MTDNRCPQCDRVVKPGAPEVSVNNDRRPVDRCRYCGTRIRLALDRDEGLGEVWSYRTVTTGGGE